jgi:hypothetical protein
MIILDGCILASLSGVMVPSGAILAPPPFTLVLLEGCIHSCIFEELWDFLYYYDH